MKFAVAFAVAALGATSVAAYADQANRVSSDTTADR